MSKILARTGMSLADLYDIVGSVAGVETLVSREVFLTHEMGGTIQSERMVGELERMTSTALAQSLTWDITLEAPPNIYRVLGVYCQATEAARTANVQVSLRNPATGREIPIFVWDSANDLETNIRIIDNGAAISSDIALVQTSPQTMPTLGIGDGQRRRVGEEIVFRGNTSAFGAGTIEIIALVYLGFPHIGDVSSHGLPLPGW